MISITQNAANKILSIAKKENVSATIRVGIKGSGCAGYSYVLDFENENKIKDTDTVVEEKDITIVVDMMSLTYLEETVVDYVDGLMGSGFKFINPSATKKCGCGSSFAF